MNTKCIPVDIEYTKDSGERSTRRIIPAVTIPSNIRALDVSDLNESDQNHMCDLYLQYQQYVDTHARTLFAFQEWVEHTSGEQLQYKWRTFKSSNMKMV
jgi:hypothetical protein